MQKTYKIEAYIPKEALEDIRNALYQLQVGKIGNYINCMNWYEVNSSWEALDGANPYQGHIGEIETATEYKLEFRCEADMLDKAIETIKAHHPYEEVGINIVEILVY